MTTPRPARRVPGVDQRPGGGVERYAPFPEGVPPEFYLPAVRSTLKTDAKLVSLVLEETSVRVRARLHDDGAARPLPPGFRMYSPVPEDRHGVGTSIPFADVPVTHGWDVRPGNNTREDEVHLGAHELRGLVRVGRGRAELPEGHQGRGAAGRGPHGLGLQLGRNIFEVLILLIFAHVLFLLPEDRGDPPRPDDYALGRSKFGAAGNCAFGFMFFVAPSGASTSRVGAASRPTPNPVFVLH